MDDETVELTRVGSLCKPDPHAQLLEAWLSRDLTTFRNILQQPEVSPDHWYDDPHLATCLFLACKEDNGALFVKALLDADAQVNDFNSTRNKAPIHVAAESANDRILEILLSRPDIDINILDSFGNTPLHSIAKQKLKDESDVVVRKFKHCIELLMNQDGIKCNITNNKGRTAIHLAAESGAKEIVQTILEHAGDDLDVDIIHRISRKSARQIITDKYPDLIELLPEKGKSNDKNQNVESGSLFQHLYLRDSDSFLADLNALPQEESLEKSNGSCTLLQYSAEHGIQWACVALLERGAKPNGTCPAESRSPALLSCYGGYPDVLYLFLNTQIDSVDLRAPAGGGTAFHAVLNSPRSDTSKEHRNYKGCLDLLFKYLPSLKLDINATDIKGNTALHYAAKNEDEYAVINLLKNGAYIGVKNVFGDPPLANISSTLLETFLNDYCLDTNKEFSREDTYEVSFSYKFLVPPVSNSTSEDLRNSHVALTLPLQNNYQNEEQETISHKLSSATTNTETEPLLYISRSRDLKHLLKHPIFTSFLELKWHQIRIFFYTNLLFYIMFVALLTLYILLSYGNPNSNQSRETSNSSIKADEGLLSEKNLTVDDESSVFWWAILVVFLVLLVFREVFQLIVSPKKYIKSPENYLEILLFLSSAGILFSDWVHENAKPHFSALAILLSWAELVLLVGRHPRLSTNIEMFKTVSLNFLKFLAWYAILIVAFALSFYTLFRDCGSAIECGEEGDSESNFFLTPGMSVFKTVVMLTGEFEAASIPFVSFPGTSHIVFVLFVFLIAIVLFNLLNGLAVSDTQAIRDDAEVVGYIARVKLLSYIESMFHGSNLPLSETLRRVCCCWPSGTYSLGSITSRVRLFPETVPNKEIRVLPNRGGKILFTGHYKKREEMEEETSGCCSNGCGCVGYTLDPGILKRAIEILNSRGKISEMEQVKELINKNQEELEDFREEVKEKHKKLDDIDARFDRMEKSWRETEVMLKKILATLSKTNSDSSDA
ncbi:hypothetical protein C0J52_09619 [Blattella germanica]|nr:hypothetical protein C0J52_09619 [Blattella germanica]